MTFFINRLVNNQQQFIPQTSQLFQISSQTTNRSTQNVQYQFHQAQSNQISNQNISNQNKFLQYNFRNQESILLNKMLNNVNNHKNSLNENEYHTNNNNNSQFVIESGYSECPFHQLRTQWYLYINYIN